MKKILILLTMCVSVNSFASDIQVGFSGGNGSGNNAISVVLNAISSANKSIDVLAYSFSNKDIVRALLQAKQRGVTIRVIGDFKQNDKSYSGLTILANSGITTKTNNNYQDFHNKVMIIDGSCVETGSFNYSASAANKNAENAIYFCDSYVASQYSIQFNYWWNQSDLVLSKY